MAAHYVEFLTAFTPLKLKRRINGFTELKKAFEPLQIELRGLNDTCGNNLSSAASMAAVLFIWLQQGVVTAGQFDQYETTGIHASACWTKTYIILYTITLMEVNLSP